MSNVKDKGKHKFNTVNPINLTLGLFSSEEIIQLSVLKVSNSNTFDSLGHPVQGGLYDPAFGPSEKTGVCSTCLNNVFKCPGHFGHIELPLPVTNPLFHDVVAKILKISCLSCHTILIPYEVKYVLINQLRLLNSGNIKEAVEFEEYFNEQVEKPGKFTKDIYDDMVLKLGQSKNNSRKLLDDVVESRAVQSIKDSFLGEVIKSAMKSAKCLNCDSKVQKIKVVQKKIITNVKVEVAQKFKSDDSKDIPLQMGGQTFIMASEAMVYLRKIWTNESAVLSELIPVLKTTSTEFPTDLFFFTVIPVTPTNIRPAKFLRGSLVEHIQNKVYKKIIDDCFSVKSIIHLMNAEDEGESLIKEHKQMVQRLRGNTLPEKLQLCWQNLQSHCDLLLVEDKNNRHTIEAQGLKQVLEKKEGVIRMHMMGKRVNFAARSVITPDPNLNIDEIGVPEEFAKNLTYPVPVTTWNVKLLRQMVLNGPDVHPGAVLVEMEDGTRVRLRSEDVTQRESIANQLLTPSGGGNNNKTKGMKLLHRHLINGDVLLMNRQPTLHKPSIMAHRARVLKGEKTIRLHYSNCKSYNADFDGDEMNAHFPQNELARSEGYNIVSVCNQYLVPKDGTPLGGLIQDHMISGVRLSVRGRFFTRDDYMQLVFQALSFVNGDIKILPPTIIKPVQLWSGKQILSTVILNIIPKDKEPINLESTAKISAKAWVHDTPRRWKAGGTPFKNPNAMTEAEVIIRKGELLCGVLDKTHYGATPYSLVHCMYELYGGECSSKLLSSFGKLFAAFLQIEGFTLGVRDILVTENADVERLEYMEAIKNIGHEAATKALDLPITTSESDLQMKLEDAYRNNPKFRQIIDRQYKTELDSFTNKINVACIPNGLIQQFPDNNLQLMVQSGAKGSTVNTMQISCLLGQIELEGKRPPLMISGRSLPSFSPYNTSPRAGGFVDGRFMTGIQPQEFFFHCMAGREGLIDTAVKTSRSGYLQRCLIKHLEGICVNYDMTVRDSDRSVIQFQYGEDGMDVSKAQFLKQSQVPFLVNNSKVIVSDDVLNSLKLDDAKEKKVKKHHKKLKSWNKHILDLGISEENKRSTAFTIFCSEMKETALRKLSSEEKHKEKKRLRQSGRTPVNTKLCKMWYKLNAEEKALYYKKCKEHPDPLSCQLQPDRDFGVISERLESLISNYLNRSRNDFTTSKTEVRKMMSLKSMTSMCSPGEPVGILAAQSIGEPSTQMTLNTFHFAGRGEMNVTLGIPRLREILMMASEHIKTPSIEVPFLPNLHKLEKKADKLRKELARITLAEVLEYVSVTEKQDLGEKNRRQIYVIHFKLLPTYAYSNTTHVKPHQVLRHIEKRFLKQFARIQYPKKDQLITTDLGKKTSRKGLRANVYDDDDDDVGFNYDEDNENKTVRNKADDSDSSEDEPEADDDDATTSKMRARRAEEQEYQEKEDEEKDEDDDDIEQDDDNDDENKDADKEKKNDYDVEDEDDKIALIDEEEVKKRIENVINCSPFIEDYRFDVEKQLWCEVTLFYPHCMERIDFATLLKEKASNSVISEVPGIRRAFTYDMDDKLLLKTDGRNFFEMFKHDKLLDLNRLYSNDIHGIAKTYGIEAAAKAIVKEVTDVFKVYAIAVDPRHLSLIADYMTFDGTIQPLNRKGIEGSVSPLQQMSFESSTRFLKMALLQGKSDALYSPSSRLMIGLPCKSGTGIVDVRLSSSMFLTA